MYAYDNERQRHIARKKFMNALCSYATTHSSFMIFGLKHLLRLMQG